MPKYIKGYICRSKGSDWIQICEGIEGPSQEEDGWFWHVPGMFCKATVRAFKKAFGFSIKPGTFTSIEITITKETV